MHLTACRVLRFISVYGGFDWFGNSLGEIANIMATVLCFRKWLQSSKRWARNILCCIIFLWFLMLKNLFFSRIFCSWCLCNTFTVTKLPSSSSWTAASTCLTSNQILADGSRKFGTPKFPIYVGVNAVFSLLCFTILFTNQEHVLNRKKHALAYDIRLESFHVCLRWSYSMGEQHRTLTIPYLMTALNANRIGSNKLEASLGPLNVHEDPSVFLSSLRMRPPETQGPET